MSVLNNMINFDFKEKCYSCSACAEACPTKALTFGDMNDPSSAVSRKVKENPVYRTKVELGTQPNLYHIPFQHGEPRR